MRKWKTNRVVFAGLRGEGNILIFASSDEPLQGFVWRMELENGARTILVDTYGASEVYYESKAGT